MYFSENTAELSCISLKLTILEVHGITENATYRNTNYTCPKCKIEFQIFLLFSQDIIILALSSGHIQILHLTNKYKLRNMP